MNLPIKILIADDDALVREGLKIIIDMDERFQVVACVENGKEAVETCLKGGVDVALLDVRMPIMTGLEAAKQISDFTEAKPLILTTFDDEDFILKAIRNGAKGYLLKNTPPDQMKDSIKLVYNGGIVMEDLVLSKIKNGLSNLTGSIDKAGFTDRELEIMDLIARGMSNNEIARDLFIAEGTVKNYISSILNKTGLDHRTQIAIYYLKGGRLS